MARVYERPLGRFGPVVRRQCFAGALAISRAFLSRDKMMVCWQWQKALGGPIYLSEAAQVFSSPASIGRAEQGGAQKNSGFWLTRLMRNPSYASLALDDDEC